MLVDQYERTLRPELLDEYVSSGYCWLVIGSLQAGRAFAQPQAAPAARSPTTPRWPTGPGCVYHVTPFGRGAHPVPFSFDWSIDYYPAPVPRGPARR